VRCGRLPLLEDRTCAICQGDVGFPNVRKAAQLEERRALASRVLSVRRNARAAGATRELRRLWRFASDAETIFNRKLITLQEWITGPSPFFFGFHHDQVHGLRPALDKYERMRIAVESTVNPGCYQHLNTAAVGGAGPGLVHYGPYRVVLDPNTIAHRASIFEKNPFIFCADKSILVGEESPVGYRAEYSRKGALALAKLGDLVSPGMTDAQLWSLVMDDAAGARQDCDFIEAHIYGPIHRDSIVSVRGPRPKKKADRAIWQEIKDHLAARGVPVRETL